MLENLDDILDSMLRGLWMQIPSSNGLDWEFVRVDDAHHVMRNGAKKDLYALMLEVIGEDTKLVEARQTHGWDYWPEDLRENEVKAEQRQRLQQLFGLSEDHA